MLAAMSKPAAQFIDPRESGLRGLDLKRPVFDDAAIARASDALEAMGESMEAWLDADIEKLQSARLAAEASGWALDNIEALATCAHDLKGMGATYGFPLVSKLAASLCRLIETPEGKALAHRQPGLVCAHVDALRAAVRDGIRNDEHPVGRALASALDAEVAKLGVAPR
jgi:chemotaxis protein histidine kinase CheA